MITCDINRNSMFMVSIVVVLSVLYITPAFSQSTPVAVQNPCASKTSCHECIQTQACAWCMQPDFGKKPRCFQPSTTYRNMECEVQYIYNPDNIQLISMARHLTRAERSSSAAAQEYFEMSSMYYNSSSSSSSGSWGSGGSGSWGGGSGGSGSSGQITQIYPQRVTLKLRINEKYNMKMFYSQAEDYPVDLYYLMDLSKSMEDDKEKLSHLGEVLINTMNNITSNFRLGFGSFVDKVLMPYVSTVPKNLQEPCTGCAAPYGYRNVMPLETGTNRFAEEVRLAAVSGNLDAPEGGFDAIMQSVVCRDQVGWRQQARRLLVFSTDAGFHYAGDGKLGGVITPNDGLCHLDSRGMYTYSTVQDYPSISQINMKVKEHSINVIFAVTQQQIDVYRKLTDNIEGSTSAVLSEDSSNVVKIIENEYRKIKSSVEMKDTSSNAVQVTYYSSCMGDGELIQTSKCDGLQVGDVVSFTAEITVISCPKNPADWETSFQIYAVGINEFLTVDLTMLCDCPCEKSGFETHSPICNGQGTFKCGICECDKNTLGNFCECSVTDAHTEKEMSMACRPDNTTLEDCSGRGQCVCGVCECKKRENLNEIIDGKFCECDNFSCERHNDQVCSGPANGICQCGVCQCLPGWMGKSCACRSSIETCMNKDRKICSGHGKCECGECICDVTEDGRWSGPHCEKCPACAGRCAEFKECVQCMVYKTGPISEEDCAKNCTLFTPKHEETLEVREDIGEHLCTFYDEDDCRYQFTYTDNEPDLIVVRAKKERDCPPKVFLPMIILAVIAAIVLIGLAILLLWKLLTTIHDRREFARFEKERMMAKWDTGENPIYKQATSTFKNPTYAGK